MKFIRSKLYIKFKEGGKIRTPSVFIWQNVLLWCGILCSAFCIYYTAFSHGKLYPLFAFLYVFLFFFSPNNEKTFPFGCTLQQKDRPKLAAPDSPFQSLFIPN